MRRSVVRIDSIYALDRLDTREDRRAFLLNVICFAACIEGLFFYGAFAYVYFLRSRGLLHGLASGTNWVFRDESMHMAFAFDVVDTVRREEPDLFDEALTSQVREMITDAVACEVQFAEDLLAQGVSGLPVADIRPTCSMWLIGASPSWVCRPSTGRSTRSDFWSCKTSRSSPNFFERRVLGLSTGSNRSVDSDEDF